MVSFQSPVEPMSRELDGGHLCVSHRDPGGIAPAIERRADMQARRDRSVKTPCRAACFARSVATDTP
jgi:hypothetical protein